MPESKTCTKCGNSFSATTEFFRRSSDTKDGLSQRCKVCKNADDAAWQAANPEKVKAARKKCYWADPEKHRADASAWVQANAEKARSTRKQYADQNKEKLAVIHAEWKKKNPLYGVWHDMVRRCTDPTRNRWPAYGAKGVMVCERWLEWPMGYENFCADMGARPDSTTLSRYLDSGNYEPSNVEWATAKEQWAERRGKIAMLKYREAQLLRA